MSERALAIEIVRGWGLKFDGTGDPKEFVDRIEDKAASYGIRLEHIAGAMKFLLKGNALSWWHANAMQMMQWNTFKRQLSLHSVPDKRSGQHPRSERGNLKRPWDTNHQSGGDLTTRSNITRSEKMRGERPPMKKPQLLADGGTRQPEDVTDIHAEESWEEDHTDSNGLQENEMELQPKGSWGKDHEVSPTNQSEETTEIPLAIQQEARWRQAQKLPGQQVCFEMSAEGKDYRVKISRSEDINICQLKPDGGTPEQEEDHEVPLTSPWEEATEIPLVIQQEARLRQSQSRPGQQVCYKRSVEGKEYRVKINRGGYVSIYQLKQEHVMDGQAEPHPTIRPQLLTDRGTSRQEDLVDIHDEESCEEDRGRVSLTNQWEEATEIPLVIQQEARLRQSQSRPGQQVCYKRSVEGKEYRVKINRGGYVSIYQQTPEQLREQPPGLEPQIPLVIQQEARWRQTQKRPGQQVCFKRSVEGKDYLVKISRSGNLSIEQLKQEHLMDGQAEPPPTIRPQLLTDRGTPQQEDLEDIHPEESCEEDRGVPLTNQWEEATEIPLVIQQEARLKQSQSRPGQQVCYKRRVEGKKYRVKINRGGYLSIYQQAPEGSNRDPAGHPAGSTLEADPKSARPAGVLQEERRRERLPCEDQSQRKFEH